MPEHDKEKFTRYLLERMEGRNDTYNFQTVRGRNIRISWQGTHVHLDDETIKLNENQEIQIETKKGLPEFLSPE